MGDYYTKKDLQTPNEKDEFGRTLAFKAAARGDLYVIKHLLKKPVFDPNTADENGWTPLYQASINGHIDVAKILIADPRIDLSGRDRHHQKTVFEHARELKNEKILALFKEVELELL